MKPKVPASRSVGDLARPILAESVRAQGFAQADIFSRWPDLVGGRLAARAMPIRMIWPPRPRDAAPDAPIPPATLVLKVESAFALEVEMQAQTIIERVNAVFGWRCVDKLRLKQGPVLAPAAPGPPPAPTLPADEAAALRSAVAGVEHDGLRTALERLGTAILAKEAKRRR